MTYVLDPFQCIIDLPNWPPTPINWSKITPYFTGDDYRGAHYNQVSDTFAWYGEWEDFYNQSEQYNFTLYYPESVRLNLTSNNSTSTTNLIEGKYDVWWSLILGSNSYNIGYSRHSASKTFFGGGSLPAPPVLKGARPPELDPIPTYLDLSSIYQIYLRNASKRFVKNNWNSSVSSAMQIPAQNTYYSIRCDVFFSKTGNAVPNGVVWPDAKGWPVGSKDFPIRWS